MGEYFFWGGQRSNSITIIYVFAMNSSIDLNKISSGVLKVSDDGKFGYWKERAKAKYYGFIRFINSKFILAEMENALKTDTERNSKQQCDVKGCTQEWCILL